ncbi:hypothetical protein CHU95_17675 [Niveispirillum lacus]|uniref:Putative auto-transporter adhesin head GIN domain-containing protein n=1 Tax=Niveispirillum lacus TaxID=1981099 RepID=A0A255YTU4_9PROT|nr:DUF2807 domain-containing protein [Niveispirillum lacus]OYQ32609.1 hypothetical protein CHU95_17675 [Niveispirillum lacus]
MRKPAFMLFATIAVLSLTGTAQAETSGPQRFEGSRLVVRDVIGAVKVTVDPSAKDVTVTIDADAEEFPLLSARGGEGGVVIARSRPPEKQRQSWNVQDNNVVITVTLPKGSAIHVDDMIGKLEVGDLDGPLTADIRAAADLKTGRLSSARIDVAGAAGIHTGDITGRLDLSIAGAGDVDIGSVRQGADISIAGFGDIDIAGVKGPVSVRVGGVGDVDLNNGDVDMLDISVAGMGSVSFEGAAKDRRINSSGLSSVRVNGKKVAG